ncbi:MAG: ion transporter [Rhodothermales bacterium]|nr:ion transporter [Rhodothermales bacterium]MBO6778939.1 ion transporter [Rhodothermales bacterium]
MSSQKNSWRERLHEIIFEADTPMGKAFDVALIMTILASVVVVMLDSVPSIRARYASLLFTLEWYFTLLFTIEYVLRLVLVKRPMQYALSFFGLVDLFAVLPTYLALLFPGTQYLLVIRLLRLLRVFRVLKLVTYLDEADTLYRAMRASRRKITVFLLAVSILVVLLGSVMYFIEGEENGFTSIPQSIYWAVVTLTTVGYGDMAPQSPIGQAVASVVMIIGYGIIAVPTGIVTAELTRVERRGTSTKNCRNCAHEIHRDDAVYCRICGEKL